MWIVCPLIYNVFQRLVLLPKLYVILAFGIMLAPKISPVALTKPPVVKLPTVAVPTALKILPTVKVLFVLSKVRPAVAFAVPLSLNITSVFAPGAATLPETLPMKLAAVTLPVALMLPPVLILPAVTVPVALIFPVFKSPPVIVPVAETDPAVLIDPPVIVLKALISPVEYKLAPVIESVALTAPIRLPVKLVVPVMVTRPPTARLPPTFALAVWKSAYLSITIVVSVSPVVV